MNTTPGLLALFLVAITATATPTLTATATESCTPVVDEGFDSITTLPGWALINHSQPLGATGWFQGTDSVFPAFDGSPTAYIAANFFDTSGVGTISNWLLTPEVSLQNGDTLTFYTRTEQGSINPDRLQVRMSTNGASIDVGTTAFDVGDFTNLLLDINPTYATGGYPEAWTQFTITISGLPGETSGRFAFRYFVEQGGPAGSRSDYIGIDRAVYCTLPSPTPTPGCYSNFTTAEGCNALSLLISGAGNTALGWFSLSLDTTGSFNSGVGGGALALNSADSNTAVGAAALLLNTTGTQNTAVGTDALVFNDSGSANTATGYFALMNNTTGSSLTAVGGNALAANTTGSDNTAIGNQALQSNATTSDNVAVGSMAGSGITTADNNIIIGHSSGVHSVFGQVSDRCTIDNIFGAPVSAATATVVMIDSDGRLGTVSMDGPDRGGFSPKGGIRPQAIPEAAEKTMFNLKVQKLRATLTQQQQQIETLTAELKRETAQIKKVNAQLEMRKPAPKTIVSKP
ncbi:MAG: choice-of-anchor J domain-containing protein [Alphaproteobacteria bacterium]